jgi:Zn-dependent protease with chaperone function
MSLAQRALVALALMVSFYLLALSIAGGLLWIAYADAYQSERSHFRLILFCLIGAGSVLWAIMPRLDVFEPPGPRVRKEEEPKLFAAIEEIARTTEQEMPDEVYLVNDVNAFVTQRGGVMGFGSRRVMGLGLPLMQAVSVQEFKAILAHEFGHYHGGDVKLGPWIYKTHGAIGRTIRHLDENVLQYIFIFYGRLFLRVTHAISRAQEFVADKVAARAAGSGAMISGLRTVHAAAVAYQGYVQTELAPVVQSGYLPPVHAGFSRFLANPAMRPFLDKAVQHEEEEGTTDPYDTHPSLRDRIAALTALPAGAPGETGPAASLLSDFGRWEARVLTAETGPEWARNLTPVSWHEVSDKVWMPMWRERVDRHGHLLRGLTIGTLPPAPEALIAIGRQLFPDDDDEPAPAQVHYLGRAHQLILAAIVVRLVPLGWTVDAMPGEDVALRQGSQVLRPYAELTAIAQGRSTAEAWRTQCTALGIAELPLFGAGVVAGA